MDLKLRPEIAANYKSLSQKARVMTETWATENMYCPSCPSDNLDLCQLEKRSSILLALIVGKNIS
jgi:type II restriction enzyme